jgi:hypothetical protein
VEFNGQELVGYLASTLVVASLAMTSVVRLRAISLGGSITFVVYGVLIGSVPIMLTNASIAMLNTWFLSRELGGRRDLGAVVVPPDSPFLLDFLAHHANDIATFQPEYDVTAPFDFALVLTRDGLPAGVVLGSRVGDRLDIDLDYVLKAYRDSRLGSWLYTSGSGVFRSAGITEVTSAAGRNTHPGYLTRVGFEYDPERARFIRPI